MEESLNESGSIFAGAMGINYPSHPLKVTLAAGLYFSATSLMDFDPAEI